MILNQALILLNTKYNDFIKIYDFPQDKAKKKFVKDKKEI